MTFTRKSCVWPVDGRTCQLPARYGSDRCGRRDHQGPLPTAVQAPLVPATPRTVPVTAEHGVAERHVEVTSKRPIRNQASPELSRDTLNDDTP